MMDIRNPIEFSAVLTSLKPSVISSTLLLMEMLKDNKSEIIIDEEDSHNIVALLMYDAMINETIDYSILDDFDFAKDGKIILKNDNKDKVREHIEFLLNYMYYRIEVPIDIAVC